MSAPRVDMCSFALDDEATRRVRNAAREAAPREACGVWLGELVGECFVVHEACVLANRATAPESADPVGFVLDPGGLRLAYERAAARGLELLGAWHSHPSGDLRPSLRDEVGTPLGWCQVILAAAGAARLSCWLRTAAGFESLALIPLRTPLDLQARSHEGR